MQETCWSRLRVYGKNPEYNMHNFDNYYPAQRWDAYCTHELIIVKVHLQHWLSCWLTACRDQVTTASEATWCSRCINHETCMLLSEPLPQTLANNSLQGTIMRQIAVVTAISHDSRDCDNWVINNDLLTAQQRECSDWKYGCTVYMWNCCALYMWTSNYA